MYSEIQRERADIGGLMARPEYREWNPELIKPKKLLNPVKASRSHQELHRELLMNHRRWGRRSAASALTHLLRLLGLEEVPLVGPGRGQQARAAARPGAPQAEPDHQEEEGGAGGQATAVSLRAGAAATAAEAEPAGKTSGEGRGPRPGIHQSQGKPAENRHAVQ
uniref:Actin-associated protein FAM107A n=1 Tax=Pipistrellus kuhlii TaxID=59472 RepID=A0A7J7WCH8_PIPKU|nr:family with sequence similarity 107 member A [Pipistrellus kuhlii]